MVTKWGPILLLVIVGIILFIYLLDQMTGGYLVQGMLCSVLFRIPYGPLLEILTQSCKVIPA